LGKAERLILEALTQVYPDALTKEEVAGKAGYEANGGSFNKALGPAEDAGAADYQANGELGICAATRRYTGGVIDGAVLDPSNSAQIRVAVISSTL
jgi:hypothetical protein